MIDQPILRRYKFVWPNPDARKPGQPPKLSEYYYAVSRAEAEKDFEKTHKVKPKSITNMIIIRQPA